MPLNVTLEISDQELDHFRSVMQRARAQAAQRAPQETAAAARAAVARLDASRQSPFITRRMHKVQALIGMVDDPEWQLPEPERRRVLDGLAYVAESQDLVPDSVPVLGLLDDAIMLELVLLDLHHELDGYEEFDEFRRRERALRAADGSHRTVSREDWLASKRQVLHGRMRERRERDLTRSGGSLPLVL